LHGDPGRRGGVSGLVEAHEAVAVLEAVDELAFRVAPCRTRVDLRRGRFRTDTAQDHDMVGVNGGRPGKLKAPVAHARVETAHRSGRDRVNCPAPGRGRPLVPGTHRVD